MSHTLSVLGYTWDNFKYPRVYGVYVMTTHIRNLGGQEVEVGTTEHTGTVSAFGKEIEDNAFGNRREGDNATVQLDIYRVDDEHARVCFTAWNDEGRYGVDYETVREVEDVDEAVEAFYDADAGRLAEWIN